MDKHGLTVCEICSTFFTLYKHRSCGGHNVRQVTIGSEVEIEREGRVETWTIKPEGESDVASGALGAHTPLAKALIGAAAGETRAFVVGQHAWQITCLSIRESSC